MLILNLYIMSNSVWHTQATRNGTYVKKFIRPSTSSVPLKSHKAERSRRHEILARIERGLFSL